MRVLVSEPLPRDKQVKGFGGGDAMQETKPLLRMKNRHVVNEALESHCVTNMRLGEIPFWVRRWFALGGRL